MAHSEFSMSEMPDMPSSYLIPSFVPLTPSQQQAPVDDAIPSPSTPEGEGIWSRKYLFGDWDGQRTRLENRGFTFDMYYTDDALGNAKGERSDFGAWGRIRGTLDVDFSKFSRAKDTTFHITGLWQYGTDLSKQYTFTSLDSSSLPSAHTVRADSFYLQQYLFHHKLALRGGQIAAYDSYGDSEYGASFINLAMGYAHSNLNSSVYFAFNPAGVPSFEVKVLPTDHLYVKGMVQSEERGPYTIDPSGFNFHLGGPVVATEIGYLEDPPKAPDATLTMGPEPFITDRETGNHPGVYKFGAGYDPHNFTDLRTGVSSPGNYLLYAQADQAVYRMGNVGEDRNRGLDLTYSEDYSPGDVSQFSHQLWAGARWIGPFGGRWAKDSIALGYVRTETGSHASEESFALGGPRLGAEHLVELNYQTQPAPWLLLQPVAQWYVNPGGNSNRESVVVLGWRTKITF
ncbi:carbohydrate porin [Silvibacterium sp.]|uniref:carbohydrate porin n=1 Tax=Silvibacterium sp. TaxID=1964179 RepID=UPI0039E70752